MFIGLVLGGLLAPIGWRLDLPRLGALRPLRHGLVVPELRELGVRSRAPIDWPGNLTFAAGLDPRHDRDHLRHPPVRRAPDGLAEPVRARDARRPASRCSSRFVAVETRVADPMFRLPLFRIRAFTFGVLSSFLSAVARGGLMFMLIIWLQGIWLPEHGYNFAATPLWAGILHAAADRRLPARRARLGHPLRPLRRAAFATGGMLGSALALRSARAPPRRLLLSGVRGGSCS